MSFSQVLERYSGAGFSISGGDSSIVEEVKKSGTVVTWYVGDDNKIGEVVDIPTRLVQIIVTTTGFIQGSRVETKVTSYLENSDVVIYHGYPEFKTMGLNVIKEVYSGGCIITNMSGEVYRLQKLAAIIPNSPSISTPFSFSSDMEPLLPYIHILTALEEIVSEEGTLRIPIADVPPATLVPTGSIDHIDTSSVYVDKERKLLLSAIDLVVRANTKDFILLYYGDLYITWIPHFLNLFSYLNPTIHLWGKDQNVVIPSSRSVLVRPSHLGMDSPSTSLYIENYTSNNKILLLADEDVEDLLSISPLLAYYPYEGGEIQGEMVIPPWTTVGRANILYKRGDRKRSTRVTQGNINYFHMVERMRSYDIGLVIDEEMRIKSDVGRHFNVPTLGLCTCYDCATEIGIICKYMKSRNIPFSRRALEGFLISNGPSLWSVSRQISKPEDRKLLMIDLNDIDEILSIDPHAYGNIGIDVDQEILENTTSTYIGGDEMDPKMRMRAIIRGERFPIVINFHRLVRNYSADRDKGRGGKKAYDDFLQFVALNKSNMDTYGILLLFTLMNTFIPVSTTPSRRL
jgi:hypothetical protein